MALLSDLNMKYASCVKRCDFSYSDGSKFALNNKINFFGEEGEIKAANCELKLCEIW